MAQSPKRNWRLESKNRENTLMRARQIIIETLLKEAADEEKLVAQALNTAFSQVAKDIKANKAKLAPETQNEAVGVALVGGLLAAPAIMGIVGKGVKIVQNILAKGKGDEPIETNTIIEMGKKLHHIYLDTVEKALFFVKDEKKRKRLASIIFHAVIAGLLVASGKGFFKALAKHQSLAAFIEAMLSAIKAGELGAFAVESFGALATALGTSAELADAAELLDAADKLSEISTAGGSVQGYSLPLGAKPEDYKMENKLKITKGRLRQILAEEVARHQKQKLNEAREGDFVEVIGGSLAGAKGKLMEPVTTTTGEAGFAIALTNDADKPVFGKAGDEAVVLASDIKPLSGMAEYGALDAMAGNPPSKIGQGNKEYMEQYNDILVFMGKDPLPMKQPDQAYLDALRSGRLEEMGVAEEEAEAAELRAEEEPSNVVNEEALEEGMSLAGRQGFLQGSRAAKDGLSPEEAEAKAKERALAMSGRELEMLQLTGLPSASPEQYELAMKDALEASASATSDYLTQFARGYHGMMSEEKTEKYDDEMEEKGFSKKQAKNLDDPLQAAMLKKEVRAMIEEMLNEELLCEECGGVHEGTCPGK